MSGSNLFHSLTVNSKKKFLKSSVRHRKGLKQPGLQPNDKIVWHILFICYVFQLFLLLTSQIAELPGAFLTVFGFLLSLLQFLCKDQN